MRELTEDEIAQVSGGLNPLILFGVAGSMFAFGYSVGVDLAEYDNETMG
jgi:lactobin A/cerein 7B family class IIb bacteriocin